MSEQHREELYQKFENGDIPVAQDFADVIDSALNLVDDGLVSYKVVTPVTTLKRFGFGGETSPESPIGIQGEPGQDDQMITFTSSDETQKWNINLNPTGQNITGFSIDDATSGIGNSRFFIDQVSEGNIGIGTVEPLQKLHVQGANSGGIVSVLVENLESAVDGGWALSALNDNTTSERTNTFTIQERNGTELVERITITGNQGTAANPIYNVGINEVVPYATLHVSRPAADPLQQINLAENTGIVVVGPIDDQNIGMDGSQIQARTGEYVGTPPILSFTASTLNIQPYGGGMVFYSKLSPEKQIIVTEEGNFGIGTKPSEKLVVNGAVTVGDTRTSIPPDGTIRFGGDRKDLEVWKDKAWQSLTTHTVTDGIWTEGQNGVIYYTTSVGNAKVGIGTSTPVAALHVKELNAAATESTAAMAVVNQAATSSSAAGSRRVGIGVNCSGTWSSNPAALNIGLYVADVSGQTAAESNVAAVLNGNVVIGELTGNSIVGQNGVNVLAIQNGAVPTSIPGITPNTGIQIYSSTQTLPNGIDTSVFTTMNGDGNTIKLFRQRPMTPADINLPNTGNAVTDALIENMRTRIDELETILKTLGILS